MMSVNDACRRHMLSQAGKFASRERMRRLGHVGTYKEKKTVAKRPILTRWKWATVDSCEKSARMFSTTTQNTQVMESVATAPGTLPTNFAATIESASKVLQRQHWSNTFYAKWAKAKLPNTVKPKVEKST